MKSIKEELEQIIWETEMGMITIRQIPVYLRKIVKRIKNETKND